jgi:hypothetical protein
VLRQAFYRITHGGTLARLPSFYDAYKNSVESNLTLDDLSSLMPLVLQLGDEGRVAKYIFGMDEMKGWELPSQIKSWVFLPRSQGVHALLQEAIDFVLTPAPLSDLVLTLAAQVTRSPTITLTPTRSNTPWPTITMTRTASGTYAPWVPLHKPSRTPIRSRTPTCTQTHTNTPTSTSTPMP